MLAFIRRFTGFHWYLVGAVNCNLKGKVTIHRLVSRSVLWFGVAVAAGFALSPVPFSPDTLSNVPPLSVETQGRTVPEIEQAPPLKAKQKQELLKSNFEKVKRDADDLVELAKSLQEDLGKANENVLSLKVVEKAEKIEKLAKKIKTTARGD